jgi:restriction system protein
MPSQYPYRHTLRNEYLGVSKIIRAMSAAELSWLVEAQLSKWDEQESRKRQQQQKQAAAEAARERAENLQARAQAQTKSAQRNIEAFRAILSGSLATNLAVQWERLLDRRPPPHFKFDHPKPSREMIWRELLGPEPEEPAVLAPPSEKPRFLDQFLPFLKKQRSERNRLSLEAFEREKRRARAEYGRRVAEYQAGETIAVDRYNQVVRAYNDELTKEKENYSRRHREFLAQQEAHNSAVLAFRSRYEAGSPEAVERYLQMALERSRYPEPVDGQAEVRFDDASKTAIVGFWLPSPADIPNIVECKYVRARKAIKGVEMRAKEFDAFYDDVVHQIAIRTMNEVIAADYAGRAEAIVFNGWVRGIDRKTGKPFTSCILSCEASRKQFSGLDLAHVSPKDCVRGLKGITAGPLVMLAPVQPILDLKRDDDRFVESKEVLGQLGSGENLAGMEWENFEHLVRELFEKEFAQSGGEVRVTQTSRDRGVDAVAFDPDPIRGGKFVIQAKRYNIVVPVSAVRDLYGTMIAEGATKGILVTTSYFGRDSREFAKDKPITLIDGENLVFMFQKHGRQVHIEALAKGDPRRGLGTVTEPRE